MDKTPAPRPSSPWITALSTYASTREKILEHRFIAEVTAELWRRGQFDFAVSHSEVDNSGYDVIIEAASITRHIQLKAKQIGGKTSDFDIQVRLGDKQSGCVVLMLHDPVTLAILEYRFLGGLPGAPLPALGDRMARHARGNALGQKAERPALRRVSITRFARVEGIAALTDRLFGELSLGG